MQLISISSGILQTLYNPTDSRIFIGDFLKTTDDRGTGLVAQVFQITNFPEDPYQNVAVAKILFSLDGGTKWGKWLGNVPHLNFAVEKASADEVLAQLNRSKQSNKLYLGALPQFGGVALNINQSDIDYPTVIFTDCNEERVDISAHLAKELANNSSKCVILDFTGEYLGFDEFRIKAGKDFKLPLNVQGIDSIYEKGLSEASPESKAVIEDVFLEVQEYVKTCDDGFIPFDSFKNVVDAEYQNSALTELVLLKHKLLKYQQNGIFADTKEQITSLKDALAIHDFIIIDLFDIPVEWHKNFIDFVVKSNSNGEKNDFHLFFEGKEENLDKELINKIIIHGYKHGVKSIISMNYEMALAKNIISYAQNFILFSPSSITDKFVAFSNLLSMLNPLEFILYGRASNLMPLVVQAEDALVENEESFETQPEYVVQQPVQYCEEPLEVFEDIEDDQEIESEPIQEYQQEEVVDYVEDIEDDFDLDFEEPQETENIETPESQSDAGFIAVETAEDWQDNSYQEVYEAPEQDSTSYDNNEYEVIEYNEEDDFDLSEADLDGIDQYQQHEEEKSTEAIRNEISQDVESLYKAKGFEYPKQEPSESLPTQDYDTPSAYPSNDIPVFSASLGNEGAEKEIDFKEGDTVRHHKYGTGVVKKIISYGSKKLCSIQFERVGRRLLDPELAVIEKV